MRVINVGRWPPPYGGVANHVRRLHRYLSAKGVESIVINENVWDRIEDSHGETIIDLQGGRLQKYWQLRETLSQYRPDVVHFHTSLFRNFIVGGFFILKGLKDAKTILTIHSGDFASMYRKRSRFWQALVKAILKKFDRVIALNKAQLDFYLQEIGRGRDDVSQISSFLLPGDTAPAPSDKRVLESVTAFSSAVDFTVLVSGKLFDYYGFELILDSAEDLSKQSNVKLGIIFVFYTAHDDAYKSTIMARIKAYGRAMVLEDLKPETFLEVVKRSDIYVRPTLIDSFGVTIAEAISQGVPSIASDVCDRPEGAILFEKGNASDLTEKLGYCIDHYSEVREMARRQEAVDNGTKILDLYRKLRSVDLEESSHAGGRSARHLEKTQA